MEQTALLKPQQVCVGHIIVSSVVCAPYMTISIAFSMAVLADHLVIYRLTSGVMLACRVCAYSIDEPMLRAYVFGDMHVYNTACS